MKKNFLKIGSLACGLFLFAACGGNENPSEEEKEVLHERHLDHEEISEDKHLEVALPEEEIPDFVQPAPVLQSQVTTLLEDYLEMKQALVESSAEGTAKAASQLLASIKDFNPEELPEEQQEYYEQRANAMQNDLRYITQAEEVEKQRDHFSLITRYTYELTKAFDANEETLYYQYCPMAFDNNGGFWLSAQEEIRNPYFGDKMLKCGRVEETIQN